MAYSDLIVSICPPDRSFTLRPGSLSSYPGVFDLIR